MTALVPNGQKKTVKVVSSAPSLERQSMCIPDATVQCAMGESCETRVVGKELEKPGCQNPKRLRGKSGNEIVKLS